MPSDVERVLMSLCFILVFEPVAAERTLVLFLSLMSTVASSISLGA